MPAYHSSMRNLAKAKAEGRPPRPWRSEQESRMIRRFVVQWVTCRGTRPSAREWARQLGVSHTWVQKLIRRFLASREEMLREAFRNGDPNFAQLLRARELTQQMRERGELRPSGRAKLLESLNKPRE